MAGIAVKDFDWAVRWGHGTLICRYANKFLNHPCYLRSHDEVLFDAGDVRQAMSHAELRDYFVSATAPYRAAYEAEEAERAAYLAAAKRDRERMERREFWKSVAACLFAFGCVALYCVWWEQLSPSEKNAAIIRARSSYSQSEYDDFGAGDRDYD